MPTTSTPSWLTADPALLGELQRRIDAGGPAVPNRLGVSGAALKTALDALAAGARARGPAVSVLEGFMRPCVRAGQDVEARIWRRRLAIAANELSQAVDQVARLVVPAARGESSAGTAWMVANGVLVTAGRAARALAALPRGRTARVHARFANGARARVAEIRHDVPSGLAFLVLERTASTRWPSPVPLSTGTASEAHVAAIGFPLPAPPGREAVSAAAYGAVFGRATIAPGRAEIHEQGLTHDCATLGNSAGALLLDLQDGHAVGVHVEGCRSGTAVGAPAIRDAMGRQQLRASETDALESVEDDEFLEAVKRTAADYKDRTGYDASFLGEPVSLPTPTGPHANDVLYYSGPDGQKTGNLPYTHFSVVMSQSRKLCFYAAVNIDGKQAKKLPRKGKADAWTFDPRIEKTMQCGKTVYKQKKVKRGRKTVTYGLDLGHMVRRLDPVWGRPYKLANDDTFHYTNACPQHKDLNRKVWGKLEKYILEKHVLAKGEDSVPKATVFTGPVLKAGDPLYRGVKLPQEYWKVVVMIHPDTGRLHATAYILSQADMVTGFEFAFGEYEAYQIPLARLERLTNLDFGSLRDFDPMATSRTGSGLESTAEAHARILGPKDLVV